MSHFGHAHRPCLHHVHMERAATTAPRGPRLLPENVLRAARKVFLASGTIEMRSLARELGIGRATLYRWNGNREELLSEVLLSLGAANLRRAEADVATPPGPERICRVHDLHIRRISDNPGLRTFVRSEPEVASRILLDASGRVHVGVVRALADFIRRQEQASSWRAPLPVDELAEVVARLSETFLYGDLIARADPDPLTPDIVLRLMLGVPIARPR